MIFSALLIPILAVPAQLEPQSVFDARMEKLFVASGVPGAGVRVVINGKIAYDKAFGVANDTTKLPAKTSMSFEIGSLSKQFTSVSALMLVQEGKLSLSETIGSILPQVPESWKSATIDQIMHHMSGIPDYEEIATYDFYNEPRTNDEVIAQAAKHELDFQPGEKFNYSNTGYYLIGMVIEKRSGMPLSQFLRRRIFDKLGMKSTYADPPTSTPMTGYHSRTGARVAQPPIAWSSSLGAGAIVSTLDDFMKWDAALYTEKLLPKNLLEKIWTPTKLNDGSVNSYGYGWFDAQFRGLKEHNHSGQTNGFTCIYRRYPEKHCSVWAFTNTYDGGGVFGMARSAMSRVMPSINLDLIPIPNDPDPARTQQHVGLISLLANGGEDLSALSPNLKNVATEARYEGMRKQIKSMMSVSNSYNFVRVVKTSDPKAGDFEEFTYRQTSPEGNKFWNLKFNKGLLVGLTVDNP
ncbi:MAG: serine hydrolase domain-containing protein [Armatimonadota bacterium]